jgi:hypothetical protein
MQMNNHTQTKPLRQRHQEIGIPRNINNVKTPQKPLPAGQDAGQPKPRPLREKTPNTHITRQRKRRNNHLNPPPQQKIKIERRNLSTTT